MKLYNVLRHKVEVDDKFFKRIMIALVLLLVLDLVLLYLVW